tara:strand:- start:438 stop:641 length:204 start_codon:yes stop_codon:yes gene_type:complete
MGKSKEIYRKNIIELDDYFVYSGKIEIGGKFVKPTDDLIYQEKSIIKNDMSKYKLKNYNENITGGKH